ncbi:putative WD-repeat protein [Paraphaeosphaeria sporulosa]|uniref:Putative WD-repeat protein n=1 Tax=Paraphaeosphaeria sporulosa TaxID=1460663 RepID=A0A177CUJ3_9PLEO|nr:putative WD-repeat protein [Paraphaeosphaeria sporulosa]OAG10550.1 putative WD-repeat protein [Paraphaeosphaeria sporulosa]
MSSTTSNLAFGNAYSSVQANNFTGSVHWGHEDTFARLPYAEDAPFNSYAKRHDLPCLANTRIDLLEEIRSWADGPNQRCIFWLRGLAGTGKSTIARTVARRYHDRKLLAASFFFSRGGGDVGHAGKFVTSIAVQLADNITTCRQHIRDAVAERSNISKQSLQDQWQHLILGPLSKLHEPGPFIIVVDALDECDNDNDVQIIVRLLAEAQSLERVRVRVFLTSRPEVPIRQAFGQMADVEHRDFVLHEISPSTVNNDIKLFIETELQAVGQIWYSRAGWPDAETVMQLVQGASGLFIWAATACRFIREGRHFAARRLETILRNDSNNSTAPEKHLDQIYVTVLQSSVPAHYTDKERDEQCRMLRHVLGSMVVLLSTLSLLSLSKLLHCTGEEARRALEDLHAILSIPEGPVQPLRLHHPSFRDFLVDRKRCDDDKFWVDEKSTHEKLASCCLQLMSAPDGLRQGMCKLSNRGKLRSEIDKRDERYETYESRITTCLSPELQYACCYWADHLERGQGGIQDGDKVHDFLRKHFLHWLEAMSLIKQMGLCMRLIAILQSLVTTSSTSVASFLRDASRFALQSVSILAKAPLQIYSSALLFSPEASIVRKAFIGHMTQGVDVLSGRDADWDACRNVLEGHSERVRAVVFSPDGQLIASASNDRTVRVWETATGQCRIVMQGHLFPVKVVMFSPDGQLLASASWDKTVRVWETATGQCRSVLQGHSDWVTAVVFSPDGQLVASASDDRTVRVWETATGQCLSVLEGHLSWVRAVVFSPDGELVASASADSTVRLWETATGQCRSVLKGHLSGVRAVIFSPDGQLLASASYDETVRVWETATGHSTGQCRSVLKGHLSWVKAVVFSPDGQLLASASADRTVRVWETATGQCHSVLQGHSDYVRAIVFSPHGQLVTSASYDGTVRVWETVTGHCRSVLKGHLSGVRAVVFSPDGQLLASASYDETVRVWETATGQCRSVLQGHLECVRAVVFSPDGQLLASASWDKTVRVWETAMGQCRSVLQGHSDWVRALVFSPDGQLLASASDDRTVRVWETATGQCRSVLQGHSEWVSPVVFSPDGQLVTLASCDRTVRVWETVTGHCRSVIQGDSSWVWAVMFPPDDQTRQTNRDDISLPSSSITASAVLPTEEPSWTTVNNEWILRQNRRFLWLPPEYRNCRTAVHKNMVCLGCNSGRVTLLSLQ